MIADINITFKSWISNYKENCLFPIESLLRLITIGIKSVWSVTFEVKCTFDKMHGIGEFYETSDLHKIKHYFIISSNVTPTTSSINDAISIKLESHFLPSSQTTKFNLNKEHILHCFISYEHQVTVLELTAEGHNFVKSANILFNQIEHIGIQEPVACIYQLNDKILLSYGKVESVENTNLMCSIGLEISTSIASVFDSLLFNVNGQLVAFNVREGNKTTSGEKQYSAINVSTINEDFYSKYKYVIVSYCTVDVQCTVYEYIM